MQPLLLCIYEKKINATQMEAIYTFFKKIQKLDTQRQT